MVSYRRCALAALVGLLGLAAMLRAAEYEQSVPSNGAVLQLQLDRVTLELSGHVDLTLTIEGTAPLEVEPIHEITSAKDWTERALGEPKSMTLPDQRMRWRQTIRLEPLHNGKLELPITPLRFRQGPKPKDQEWKWHEQTWKTINVEVTTVVEVPALTELRDITSIETLPPVPSRNAWLIGGAVSLLAVTGVGLSVWRQRRRKPRPSIELPSHLWALRELERVDALDLVGLRDVERYHTLISGVLRRYIELRFGVHAPEQTTSEFLEALRRSSTLPPAQQELLREFLHRCDLAKFARADYTARECSAAAAMARDIIQQTAQPAAPAAASGQVAQ